MDRCLFASAVTANNSVVTGQAELKEFAHKDTIELAHHVSELIVFWIAIIPALIAAASALKHRHNPKPKFSFERIFRLSQTKEIEDLLVRIITASDACRVAIALFGGGPNHGKFSLDLSQYQYYSLVWEEVNFGISRSKETYQEVPMKEIKQITDDCLQKPEEFLFLRIDDPTLPEKTLYDMSATNNKLILFRLIGSAIGGFIGILGIQFTENISILPEVMEKLNLYFLLVENLVHRMIER